MSKPDWRHLECDDGVLRERTPDETLLLVWLPGQPDGSLDSIVAAIEDEWKDDLKMRSARRSFEQTAAHTVQPGEGNDGL